MAKSAKKSKKSAPVRKKAPVKAKPVKKAAKPVVRARARKPVAAAKPAVALKGRPARKPVAEPKKPLPPPRRLPAAELKKYREVLQKLRDRVVDEISFLAGDNLNRSPRESSGDLSSYSFHMADQGTDNFDREFALNLVSSEQDALYEIDEALQRIETGLYGSCDSCGKPIEKARLKALPFAKMCVHCKSESEKGRSKFRPFGPTIQQGGES
ncbi:MAG: TraR/DksA C4-type zinc finger protein [Kiritimatiellae bacterium]|nr:TraR/DksA C4-type zinc finger protein [Kiritimatiellia bacterium]